MMIGMVMVIKTDEVSCDDGNSDDDGNYHISNVAMKMMIMALII